LGFLPSLVLGVGWVCAGLLQSVRQDRQIIVRYGDVPLLLLVESEVSRYSAVLRLVDTYLVARPQSRAARRTFYLRTPLVWIFAGWVGDEFGFWLAPCLSGSPESVREKFLVPV